VASAHLLLAAGSSRPVGVGGSGRLRPVVCPGSGLAAVAPLPGCGEDPAPGPLADSRLRVRPAMPCLRVRARISVAGRRGSSAGPLLANRCGRGSISGGPQGAHSPARWYPWLPRQSA